MEKINGLILAAGKSSRMKEDKALLKVKGEINLCKIINIMKDFTKEIAVVVSQNYLEIKNIVSSCNYVYLKENKKAYLGMFSSVKTGVQHLKDSDFIFLHPVDNMFIPFSVYRSLSQNLCYDYDFIKPFVSMENGEDKGGHPIVITKSGINLILKADFQNNLRDIMRNSKIKFVEVEHKEILFNVNTKEDLNKYLEYVNGKHKN